MYYRRKKGSKYNAKKIHIDGITFDSKKEAKRYVELKEKLDKGEIYDLELQKVYELIPNQYAESTEIYQKGSRKGQPKKGRLIERKTEYVADFCYTRASDNKFIVEDVKSPITRTPQYIIKRKLMLYKFGIEIVEI